ncbi:MAG: hypothetical protein AB8B78_01635 [Polaribacter sp.]
MKKVILTLVLSFSFLFSFGSNLSEKNLKEKSELITINNLVKNVIGSCTITIKGYNQDGELVHYHQFTVPANSRIHCAQITMAFRKIIENPILL